VTLVTFHVAGKPVTKGSWAAFRSKKTGRINFVGPKGLAKWQKAVHDEACRACGGVCAPLAGALRVYAIFHLPRPKSADRAEPIGERDGDVDKYLRAILDALTGVVYKSDAQVVDARGVKRWALGEPGVDVWVGRP